VSGHDLAAVVSPVADRSPSPKRAHGRPEVPLLEVEHVAKRYGSVEALADVSFALFEGEVVGLVGDNGAGKSTLVKCVAGVVRPSEGAIHLSGTRHEFESPAAARDAGVETVYQDLALVESFDLAANLFLGRELVRSGWLGRLGVLRKHDMKVAARGAIGQLPARFPDLDAPIDTMSGGQRQVVAIAKAAFWGRRLLLLDEPTAALGVQESAGVLDMIAHAAARGDMAMIVIAHNLQHVFQVCSRVLVLRRGRLVADLLRTQTSPEEVVAYITGARE
jgi:ABC-type sugar transport system ATPase subunit